LLIDWNACSVEEEVHCGLENSQGAHIAIETARARTVTNIKPPKTRVVSLWPTELPVLSTLLIRETTHRETAHVFKIVADR
jgi:hypothetical protein